MGVRTLVAVLSLSGGLAGCTDGPGGAPGGPPPAVGATSAPSPSPSPSPTLAPSAVSFETLVQGDSRSGDLKDPTLVVAGTRDQAGRITPFVIERRAVSQLQTVDFDRYWLVAVLAGQKPSAGYGIEVRSIVSGPGGVRITVEQTRPAPDSVAATVLSYPFHLVLIPRDQLSPAPGTGWEVHERSGALLTRATYP